MHKLSTKYHTSSTNGNYTELVLIPTYLLVENNDGFHVLRDAKCTFYLEKKRGDCVVDQLLVKKIAS